MIWRSLTCFSLLAAAACTAISLGGQMTATVTGTVELVNSRIASVARDKDYSGVVISLRANNPPEPNVPAKHAVMLQKNKMFTPHVLPVLAGTTIDFPNGDPIFHSAFSTYGGQIFDLGLYAPGTSRSVKFRRPGIVRVFCNIHPAMSAVILVLPTPYFVVTQRDGSFHLEVPPGSYDLEVFHERATDQVLRGLSRRIVVEPGGTHIPRIVVSEAGYLIAPHKNKFGKDYEAAPDDQSLYPGTPR
jgi:plastocyanin